MMATMFLLSLLLLTITTTQAFLVSPSRLGAIRHRIDQTSCPSPIPTKTTCAAETSSTSTPITYIEADPTPTDQIPTVEEFLSQAIALGPIGSDASEEEQQSLLTYARNSLQPINPSPNPTSISLPGNLHQLLYSNSKGGSSGKLGPFVGKVTQEFVDDTTFINAVEFFGGIVRIALTATREVLDSERIRVKFQSTKVTLLGNEVVNKDVGGVGVWKMLFVGTLEREMEGVRKRQLVRVMETPSLFVLVQDLD